MGGQKISKEEKRIKKYKDEYNGVIEILEKYNLDNWDIFMYIKLTEETKRLSCLTTTLLVLTGILIIVAGFNILQTLGNYC